MITESGAYHYRNREIKKYHSEKIKPILSMSAKTKYDSSDCWIVSDAIASISFWWEVSDIT